MRYVYVVTRIPFPTKPNPHIRHIPNLGCHGSYKKAYRHYESVIRDRMATTKGTPVPGDGKIIWHATNSEEPFELLMSDHFPEEEIRLERWAVK